MSSARRGNTRLKLFLPRVDSDVRTVQDILNLVEELAPPQFAFSFDRIGLQVGDAAQLAKGVLTTLDCTHGTIDFAKSAGQNIIVSHHPLIWDPLTRVLPSTHCGGLVKRLIESEISLIVAHTNWDCAAGGVNDALAEKLGLVDVKPLGSRSDLKTFKIVTYVPSEQTTSVSAALAEAGAGTIGQYEHCSFTVSGSGTFRGKNGARPAVGFPEVLTTVAEDRLEMILPASKIDPVLSALSRAHPYEEPAYDLVPVNNSCGYPIGRIGNLKSPQTAEQLAAFVDKTLGTKSLIWSPKPNHIMKLAVVGGAADGEWTSALRDGADAFLTGEVKHNIVVEATGAGLTIFQAGHYATEQPGMEAMARELSTRLDMPVSAYEPPVGLSGRNF